MLQLSDVQLSGQAAFDHEFGAGEITVVLGSNRSGKTNLCRLIAGLPADASGRVAIDGENQTLKSPRERPVAKVYQAFVNYPNLTVADNIASPLRARGLEPVERNRRVHELAKQLQIEALLDRFPHQLSGGQQQRVAIARALAQEARVLLLDEPLVNLDLKLREALEAQLRELLQATNAVVIYTSSDPRDAMLLGDQVLLLKEGRMLQSGTPMAVYQQPASLEAMDLLTDPGVNRIERNGAWCGIRPEHLLVSAEHDGPRFDLRVTACETDGNSSLIHGDVESNSWVVRAPGIARFEPGTTVPLSARAEDLMVFE